MTPEERAARERKQKIFVVVGGLVLVGLLAIQLPKVLGGSTGSTASTTTASDTVETEPAAQEPTTVSIALGDTDRPLPADASKLRSLGSFGGKDPFVQQAEAPPSPETEAGSGGGTSAGPGGTESEGSSTGFSVGEPAASVTVISVNGVRQVLSPGSLFPSTNPTFVLVGERAKTKSVTIGVAGGQYEGGAKATKLTVGKPLLLVNTTTGARYRLVLVAVGDGSSTKAGPAASDQKKNGGDSP